MTLTVFGATGQVGKRVVKYALAKGIDVRAFSRDITKIIDVDNQDEHLLAIKGSVFHENEVFNAIDGADAVISVLGGSFDGVDKTRSLGIKTIVSQMQKAGVDRIVALGNTAILSTPDGALMIDQPQFPRQFLPVAREHLQAYQYINNSSLKWTFVCSPEIKDAEKTGSYIIAVNYPPHPDKHFITAGDLAAFMIEEAMHPAHPRQRIGISAT